MTEGTRDILVCGTVYFNCVRQEERNLVMIRTQERESRDEAFSRKLKREAEQQEMKEGEGCTVFTENKLLIS